MTKTASTNYSASGTNFVMPSADEDQFDRTDMTLLATAVEGHDHTSTKGLQIPTAGIEDDAVSNAKLANITRGSVKVGGASNAPTDLDAKTSGRILVGDGTDVLSVAVSGDATLAASGALTIAADAVSNAKLANMTRGTVKVGGASDAPTDLDAKTSGYILVGDGTDINSVAISGDATLAANGALTVSSATGSTISRQGGNATDWSVQGTNTYTETATSEQSGVKRVTFSGSGNTAQATVTLPVAYSQVNGFSIQCTILSQTRTTHVEVATANVNGTNNQFVITVYDDTISSVPTSSDYADVWWCTRGK